MTCAREVKLGRLEFGGCNSRPAVRSFREASCEICK